jgi:hypothetical protein
VPEVRERSYWDLHIGPSLSYIAYLQSSCKKCGGSFMCAGKTVLAVQENFGLVAECDCGTIQVTIGPVSLSIDCEALRKLHSMIGTAIEHRETMPSEIDAHKAALLHTSHLAMRKVMKLKH